MDVNVTHLSLHLGGGLGDAKKNFKVAQDFVLAEDDREYAELSGLLAPSCHISSFSGVVRGRGAAVAVLESEHEDLRVVWDTKLLQLTADTFERKGRVLFLTKRIKWISNVPFVREAALMLKQQPCIEHLVVGQDGHVVFRALGFKWRIGVDW